VRAERTGPPGAVQAIPAQVQQAVLRDPNRYLSQVRVQLSDEPDAYNRFLYIVKESKC
jgi:histone deacetylase complex regulatory component SIN3